MTGEQAHIPPVVRMRKVVDRRALGAALRHWAQLPRLERVIVPHGGIIGNDAPAILNRIAGEIAA